MDHVFQRRRELAEGDAAETAKLDEIIAETVVQFCSPQADDNARLGGMKKTTVDLDELVLAAFARRGPEFDTDADATKCFLQSLECVQDQASRRRVGINTKISINKGSANTVKTMKAGTPIEVSRAAVQYAWSVAAATHRDIENTLKIARATAHLMSKTYFINLPEAYEAKSES